MTRTTPTTPNDQHNDSRVGGRQEQPHSPQVQGGYLDNCIGSEAAFSSEAAPGANDNPEDNIYTARPDLSQTDLFWCQVGPDILIDHTVPPYRSNHAPDIPPQFRDVNLAPFWQRIASHLGPVAFLELLSIMWRFAPMDGERQRVDIPTKESMRKLWRNGLIRQCAAQGLDTAQTLRSLQHHGLDVSPTTIGRVLKYIPFDD